VLRRACLGREVQKCITECLSHLPWFQQGALFSDAEQIWLIDGVGDGQAGRCWGRLIKVFGDSVMPLEDVSFWGPTMLNLDVSSDNLTIPSGVTLIFMSWNNVHS